MLCMGKEFINIPLIGFPNRPRRKLINIVRVAPVRVAPVWPRVLFVLFERSTSKPQLH